MALKTLRQAAYKGTHARPHGAQLLPMSRARADALSLRYHVSLEAMRTGRGSLGAAQALMKLTLVSGFLAEAGYGQAAYDELVACQNAVTSAVSSGVAGRGWALDNAGFEKFASIVTLHDRQLQIAPLSAFETAARRFKQSFSNFRHTDRTTHQRNCIQGDRL